MSMFLNYFFMQNGEALLQLPTEVKTLVLVCFGLSLVFGLINRLNKIIGLAIALFLTYFLCVYFHII